MSRGLKIGFVGLGAMGFGMASNILAKHGQLNIICNRNRKPIDILVNQGAKEYETVDALAADSDVILLCLPNSDVVEKVISEMKQGLTAGKIVIDTGTSSLQSTERLAKELANCNVEFAEAPLTGGIKQAEAAELGAMVGAEPGTFSKIESILKLCCISVQHFGPVGAGARAKFINNYMVMGIAALVTEAFHTASITGTDWDKLYDLVIRGSADSGVLRRIIGNAKDGDFKGYVFSVDNALKDMKYITEMNASLGPTTPLNKAVLDFFEHATQTGYGGRLLSELLLPDVREKLLHKCHDGKETAEI